MFQKENALPFIHGPKYSVSNMSAADWWSQTQAEFSQVEIQFFSEVEIHLLHSSLYTVINTVHKKFLDKYQ